MEQLKLNGVSYEKSSSDTEEEEQEDLNVDALAIGSKSPILLSKSKSTTSNQTHICTYCQKVFKKVNKLKRHISSIHLDTRPFECDFEGCTEKFKRKDHLIRHKKSRHATIEDRLKLKCQYYGMPPDCCLMTFPNRDQLRKHVKRKHEKNIICEICMKEQ